MNDVVHALRAAGCVFAEDEAALLLASTDDPTELAARVARRVGGEPLEQVLGWVEFLGRRWVVEPGVFVPRPRTEALVEHAASLARETPVVLDLCCGAGVLGAALARLVPGTKLYAADIDPRATACARRNVPAGTPVYEGDLFDAVPDTLRGRIDVLLCNTPYVPTDEIALLPPEARDHEPHATLDGGADGLDVQRRVAAVAGAWLAPGGHLLVESSSDQSPRSLAIFEQAGLVARIHVDDERDAAVVVGTRA